MEVGYPCVSFPLMFELGMWAEDVWMFDLARALRAGPGVSYTRMRCPRPRVRKVSYSV